MKKIIKINEAVKVSANLTKDIEKLVEKKGCLSKKIELLDCLDVSSNYASIVEKLKNEVEELNTIIETFEYYNDYIDNVMNSYDTKFDFYKNKLISCIDEIRTSKGDLYE